MLKDRVNKMRNGSEMRLDTSALQGYPDRHIKVSRRLQDRDLLASFDPVCSHVIDHVYVGSGTVASSHDILLSHGITHILNSAGYACPEFFPHEFVYMTLWLKDSPSEDITSVLYLVFDFIEGVRKQGGRVFVHCCKGVSRSTSLVIAYLTWLQRCTFQEAFNFVKTARTVTNPNLGFACQLLQFQKQLQQQELAGGAQNKLRVYRMAPHSAHDPLRLVPKKVTGVETATTLDSRGVFVIHGQGRLFVWHGCVSDGRMARAGREFAEQLVRYEKVEGTVVEVREEEEGEEFWDLLRTGIFSRTSSDVSSFGEAGKGEEAAESHVVDREVLVKRLEGLRPSERTTTLTTTTGTEDAGNASAEGKEAAHGKAAAEGEEEGSSPCLNPEDVVEWLSSPRKRLCRLKTYAIYDKDFELFEHAKGEKQMSGGEKPMSPGLKDNGWRRLKEKIFLGASSDATCSDVAEGAAATAAPPSP